MYTFRIEEYFGFIWIIMYQHRLKIAEEDLLNINSHRSMVFPLICYNYLLSCVAVRILQIANTHMNYHCDFNCMMMTESRQRTEDWALCGAKKKKLQWAGSRRMNAEKLFWDRPNVAETIYNDATMNLAAWRMNCPNNSKVASSTIKQRKVWDDCDMRLGK